MNTQNQDAKHHKEGHSCCAHQHHHAPMSQFEITSDHVIYTCPMHPQIRQDKPGTCPLCGMALEPEQVSITEQRNPEYHNMFWRFIIASIASIPVIFLSR